MNQLFRRKTVNQILKEADEEATSEHSTPSLRKTLTVRDLTSFGIAAIIGAGVFGTIGNAAANGGAAVTLLFIFTGIACAFSAMCYAEFASAIPIAGSAYTYAYTAFGELVAWIIGWALLMEYGIGNIAVAISWSDYFTGFVGGLGWHIPTYFTMDYFSAYRIYSEAVVEIAKGIKWDALTPVQQSAHTAWTTAPNLLGIRVIADLPALFIVISITGVIYVGINESKTMGNIMVGLKLSVILMVIAVGFFYVDTNNWTPFAPNGFSGVMKGVSAVFFAYIGFDAISVCAEESKNPQKDLPRAMIYSLIICTILYILISLVLTGMVPYTELAVGDPLAYIFERHHINWFSGIIAASAIVAMASVLLVFQMGQPRIWMRMSKDGLMPPAFGKIHPKFRTPAFATVMTGIIVSVPCLFMNLTVVTDLASIGTLFAFVLVCGGVLKLQNEPNYHPKFKVPYINSKFILPVLFVLAWIIGFYISGAELFTYFLPNSLELFEKRLLLYIFVLAATITTVFAFKKSLSLFPTLGLLSCFYLMTELHLSNWIGFTVWLLMGLVIYFSYGINHSKLKTKN